MIFVMNHFRQDHVFSMAKEVVITDASLMNNLIFQGFSIQSSQCK